MTYALYLWNDIYRGVLVHNRIRMIKDPETGKRVSRPNPPAEWQTHAVPALRIVDDATWAAAQAVKERYSGLAGVSRRRTRPKHPLSGLLRCGCCGASFTVVHGEKTRCATRREGGACTNERTVLLSVASERVLTGLRRGLLAPKALSAFVKTYEAERRRLRREQAATMARDTSRLQEIDAAMERIVDAIARGVAGGAMERKLVELEAEAADLRARLGSTADDTVIDLHPGMVDRYRREIDDVLSALTRDDMEVTEASALLRRVIDYVAVVPLEGRGRYELRAMTHVETLIGMARGRMVAGSGVVVAEEGYHRNATIGTVPLAC